MRKCELFVLVKSGLKSRGFFGLEGGKLEAFPAEGADLLFETLLKFDNVVKDKAIRREEDPVGWFEALPVQYHGTYLRAQMVEGTLDKLAGQR